MAHEILDSIPQKVTKVYGESFSLSILPLGTQAGKWHCCVVELPWEASSEGLGYGTGHLGLMSCCLPAGGHHTTPGEGAEGFLRAT